MITINDYTTDATSDFSNCKVLSYQVSSLGTGITQPLCTSAADTTACKSIIADTDTLTVGTYSFTLTITPSWGLSVTSPGITF